MKYDVWSAGIVLYIMTTGEYPFDKPNLIVLWNNISKASYVIPDFVGPHLSELLEGMMEVDVNNRWDMTRVKKHPWLRRSRSTPRKTIREYKRSLSKKKQEHSIDERNEATSSEKEGEGETPKKMSPKTDNDGHRASSASRSLSNSRDQTNETAHSKVRSRSVSHSNNNPEIPIKPLQTVFDEQTIASIMQSLSNYGERGSHSITSSNAEDDNYSEGRGSSIGDSDTGSASGSQKWGLPLKYVASNGEKDKKCLVM